ncbi:pyridoxal phosphate-dependent aminotransferase [Thermosulfurimonas sp. F29]|uniref:pyridoxal phosphate-dependent aminotransferase n=1 Tax=Thermosulfurimonas sp. F29 TaxID=2867247 RepID=UPI001C839401|nr:pyridoxal phosphate-dependent aminotransferase [Thermosulfurimonas sp. F29]MBX6422920.1 pyridoxal phosphate-dependent aminotransferase [Thermosulfurimonas sp. F29]
MIAARIKEYLERASWIRKMFEEGARLKARYGADRVCDFSLGNPDVPPPPEVSEALREIVSEDRPELHAYMPNAGFPFAREAMARKVSREQGLEVSAEEVILTCGAAGGLNIIFKALLNPGEEVVFPSPFFVEYGFYVENHHGVPRPVPTREDFSLDLEALSAAIGPRTRAVLINSPHNPTGRLYPEEDIARLGELLREKSRTLGRPVYLISDEPYRNLVFDGRRTPSVFLHYEASFVVSSFSKELSLPGERIGFVAVHPEMPGKEEVLSALILANRILGFVNAPALAQRIAARCAESLVDVSVYERRRDLLCEILSEAGLEYVRPEGAFYVFPRTPVDDVEFCRLLQEELILAVPGRGFGAPGHIRLAFCVDEKIIERSREGFKRAVEKARKGGPSDVSTSA